MNTPCVLWRWYIGQNGYGQLRHNGRAQNAHAVAYERAYGPIPKGLVIDHLYRTKACINPDHLEAVPQGENIRRGNRTQLDWAKVRKIRRLRIEGANVVFLSKYFGISQTQVRQITGGLQWKISCGVLDLLRKNVVIQKEV